jgi:hypothetical protein
MFPDQKFHPFNEQYEFKDLQVTEAQSLAYISTDQDWQSYYYFVFPFLGSQNEWLQN